MLKGRTNEFEFEMHAKLRERKDKVPIIAHESTNIILFNDRIKPVHTKSKVGGFILGT